MDQLVRLSRAQAACRPEWTSLTCANVRVTKFGHRSALFGYFVYGAHMDFLQFLGLRAGAKTPAPTALLGALYAAEELLDVSRLTHTTKIPRTTVNRELAALVEAELVIAENLYGRTMFRANRDHDLYGEILRFLALTNGIQPPLGRPQYYWERDPAPYTVEYQWEHRYPPHLISKARVLPNEEYTGPSVILARLWARQIDEALDPIHHAHDFLQAAYREFHVERDRDLIHYILRLTSDEPFPAATLFGAADIAQSEGHNRIGALAFERARLDLHLARERLTSATALMHRYAQARINLDEATSEASHHNYFDEDDDGGGGEAAPTAVQLAQRDLESLPRWGGDTDHSEIGLAGERLLWTLLDACGQALEELATEWTARSPHPLADLDPHTSAGWDRMLSVIAAHASSGSYETPRFIARDLGDEKLLLHYARHDANNPAALPDCNNHWWPVVRVTDLEIGSRIPASMPLFNLNPDYTWETIIGKRLSSDNTAVTITTESGSTEYPLDRSFPITPQRNAPRFTSAFEG